MEHQSHLRIKIHVVQDQVPKLSKRQELTTLDHIKPVARVTTADLSLKLYAILMICRSVISMRTGRYSVQIRLGVCVCVGGGGGGVREGSD